MGAKASNYRRFIPKYITNFNLENRALKQVERIRQGYEPTTTGGGNREPLRVSPRHPSTVDALKEHEKQNIKGADIYPSKLNENLRKLGGVSSQGVNPTAEKLPRDKRPKKENELAFQASREFDVDLDNYGYAKPEKIRAGNLTLRQFDELANEFKREPKESRTLKMVQLAERHNLSEDNLAHMLDYFKPFTRFVEPVKKENAASKELKSELIGGDDNVTIQSSMQIENIFPNLSESQVKEESQLNK